MNGDLHAEIEQLRLQLEGLRAKEAWLDRTGRIAGVGGWRFELGSGRIHWSDQTCRIHDLPPGYQPTLDEALGYYPAESRPVIQAAVQRAARDGTPWDLELPFVTASGRRLWVRAVGEAEIEDGQVVRLMGAFQDISERRRQQEELRLEQDLRLQMQAHAAELDRLVGERGRMLDVLAHEVRQPLNNASAALQSAESVLAEVSDSQAVQRLRRAQNVLNQVMASIDNTLAAAALLARAEGIEREDVDIDTLLALAIADLPPGERPRVHIERSTRTRTAGMDMSLMRLALRNVLVNAIDYSAGGAPVVLRISDSDEPLALVIDVIDCGPGVEAALLPRLFQRGARGEQQRQHWGHGLGLYIVRRVMELHDGSVTLLRNDASGATMRLLIGQAGN